MSARLEAHFLSLFLLVPLLGGGHHVAADAGHSAIRLAPPCPTVRLRHHCCDARPIDQRFPAGVIKSRPVNLNSLNKFGIVFVGQRNSLKNNPWAQSTESHVCALPALLLAHFTFPSYYAEEWQLAAESTPSPHTAQYFRRAPSPSSLILCLLLVLLSPNGGFNWGLVVGPLLLLALVIVFNGVHQIPEGHVGLYWTGGALQDTISPPGWAVKVPY
jgi:hypothetical protein